MPSMLSEEAVAAVLKLRGKGHGRCHVRQLIRDVDWVPFGSVNSTRKYFPRGSAWQLRERQKKGRLKWGKGGWGDVVGPATSGGLAYFVAIEYESDPQASREAGHQAL